MGKTLELLGLAGFNVFIALILSVTFLGKSARAPDESVSALTKSHIETFINDVTQISGGLREDMDSYGIADYLMNHIAEDSVFSSRIEYQVEGFDQPFIGEDGQELEMGKLDFIGHILEGIKVLDHHEAAVRIEYIEIDGAGQSAMVTTTSHERGIMPVDDGTEQGRMIPVTGVSYCEQRLVLSEKKIIQMAGATCQTSISVTESF